MVTALFVIKIMENKDTEKTTIPTTKSFLTVGPTLHYSHKNVQRCWILALAVFIATCCFWSKILTGSFRGLDFEALLSPKLWHLSQAAITGISIFEYPWQILVLGLLMGILAMVPALISQLMSIRHGWPFILAVALLANLPGLAIAILISCFAAVLRPLRFRSRFIAIGLCMSPQLIYWILFSSAADTDPIKWGFSFTPWICAWLTALAIAGIVLGIGHFTRYRPGLVGIVTFLTLMAAVIVFQLNIGFGELDYQLYIAKNNPEKMSEFHAHSITNALDEQITKPAPKLRRYIASRFYPTEPILLRAELKKETLEQLSRDNWPTWFTLPTQLRYQATKQRLFQRYDLFIKNRPQSRRMPIALYYNALLTEYSPDIKILENEELLTFYSDYPFQRAQEIWYWLYDEFGDSAESVEARWRIAKNWAGQEKFDLAEDLLKEAQIWLTKHLNLLEKEPPKTDTLFSPFQPPAQTVMTKSKLNELQRKLNQLQSLISKENRINNHDSARNLAEFVMLNHHASNYPEKLENLLYNLKNNSPLSDNILLAQTKLIADDQLRAEKLAQLHKKFQNTDGGIQALYELSLLKISMWRRQNESNTEQKKKHLLQTRLILTEFIELYPKSFWAQQVKTNLENLPTPD